MVASSKSHSFFFSVYLVREEKNNLNEVFNRSLEMLVLDDHLNNANARGGSLGVVLRRPFLFTGYTI